MATPYVGEIRMFAGNFAPRGWDFCAGQLLAISDNDPLFSLLGTTYGGDGQVTFGLPDLRGRVPIHAGPNNPWGQQLGTESVTLLASQIPNHTHQFTGFNGPSTGTSPSQNAPANATIAVYADNPNPASLRPLAAGTVSSVGGNLSHSNIQPYLCINFIISLFGVYPSRS